MTEPARSPFSANIPNFQTHWDSTSLGWFKTCPKLYQYQMLEQWSPRHRSIHLTFGGLYASGVEHYARYRAENCTHDDATLRMVRYILESSGERSPDGLWTAWSPGDHPDANIKNRYTLVRSLVWNCEERNASALRTVILANGQPAVELTFNFAAFEIEGETISLSGHMDELVEANDQYMVLDDKTTKGPLSASYFRQYTPNNQMSLYAVAGKVILDKPISGVMIKAAQIGVTFTRFQIGQASRPASVLAEWLEDTKAWITLARTYAIAGRWPMNDKSCGNYGGCPFQKVCAVSPSHREAWLQDDFVKSEWNPLIPRTGES